MDSGYWLRIVDIGYGQWILVMDSGYWLWIVDIGCG